MSRREWKQVNKANPCPACGKPDWCAWTREGWLKCERSTDAPAGMVRVSEKDGGGVFKPADDRLGRRGDGDANRRKAARGAKSVAVTSDDADGRTFATAREAVAELERRHGQRSATWTYTNAAGDPIGLVVRWSRAPKKPGAKPGKDIRPASRNADGSGWYIGGMPTPRPLYALPELLATKPGSRVWVHEGEPKADAARAMGQTATTSPHGAKSAAQADLSPLAGHDVVILPDHDDAGERYAADVTALATAAGAKSVRIVRLVDLWADMPEGGDIVDLIEHRGGDADAVRAEVESLADKTEPTKPDAKPDAPAIPAFIPFPVDVLPEPIRRFIVDAAKAIGCDMSYVALPTLSALAAAIGNTHRLRLSNTWHAPPILWTAIVGESGSMKSPAFKLAMKPIRKAQTDAFKEHESARATWEGEQVRYDAELTGWKRKAVNGKDAGDPPEKPAPPIARRYIVSDTTTEALAPILLGNPRGVLLARDELAGWLGSFDRYAKAGKAGADSAHWLSMHDGEAMTIDRKSGTPPTIHVPSASVCIAGGIQPGILARAMGPEHHESGMLARLLFAMPPRKAKRWTEADVTPETEAAVAAVFDRLYAMTTTTDAEGDRQPRLVMLTPEAKAAWVQFYNEHNADAAQLTGDESAAWSKLEGYAPRLALVIHLIRVASGDPTLSDPSRVDEVSIAGGVALARWFGNEARRVYAMLGESDGDRKKRQLVEWIESKGGVTTVREVTRGLREYRNDPEGAAAALGELVKDTIGAWVVDDHAGGRGRPADRFRLLSGRGDTGDGDINRKIVGNRGNSVTVTTHDKPTDAGEEWGEM